MIELTRLTPREELLRRMRCGLVAVADVRIAARLGHAVACELFPKEPEVDWVAWAERKGMLKETVRGRAVLFAILCAEKALPEFESLRPGDDRPRKAIEAARACWREPTGANRKYARAAANAAASAANADSSSSHAAAYAASHAASAAHAVAFAAAHADSAAYDVAYAAAHAASYSAHAASHSSYSPYSATAAIAAATDTDSATAAAVAYAWQRATMARIVLGEITE